MVRACGAGPEGLLSESRRDGERVRLEQAIGRMRANLGGLEIALRLGGHIGTEVAQGVMNGAVDIAMTIAKHDAYDQVERDAGGG